MLNERYLFKHLAKEGLIIQVLNYNIESAKILSESCNLSLPIKLTFLVFWPPQGTLLEGIVKENNESGIIA